MRRGSIDSNVSWFGTRRKDNERKWVQPTTHPSRPHQPKQQDTSYVPPQSNHRQQDPRDQGHIFNDFIHIISTSYLHKAERHLPIPSLLLPTKRILHAPSNRAIRVEVLANRTIAGKWSADLLANAADGAVLGESAADGALCVEGCGGFLVGGVLAAGKSVSMIEMFRG